MIFCGQTQENLKDGLKIFKGEPHIALDKTSYKNL
jgi:hypothetical protein